MSVRDDTPEGEAPPTPPGGRERGDRGAPERRDPERRPLGYYYDDGTNYETYDPRAEDEPEGQEGETGPNP